VGEDLSGPQKGDFIAPPEIADIDERADALPAEEAFWRPPTRFGSVPVEKAPLGWDRRKGFRKLFPQVMLPFQVVERVSFGHSGMGVPPMNHGQDAHATSKDHGRDGHATPLEPNRLFWGDNLHVMRQLPSESIDLIYIDPPFFSGRNYNVIFGDQNELRSFSDIWEGGMPGYLIWLNARLYEMKRLLKKTGNIYVHLDWHASHYVKVEMDKIFGHDNFRDEIIWSHTIIGAAQNRFPKAHETILWYAKADGHFFNEEDPSARIPYKDRITKNLTKDENGYYYTRGRATRQVTEAEKERKAFTKTYVDIEKGKLTGDVWTDIPTYRVQGAERIGYPTQKPEALLERIIGTTSPQEGVVADFFCGGGTTAAVAQRLGRRWIACDQSRVAVAITADRLTRQVEEQTGRMFPVPDFTIEHWGVYEARRLAEAPPEQFRAFVLRCFGAVEESSTGVSPVNHGRDGHATLNIRQGARLPHWTAEGATYAITFRLGDSLPKNVLDAWLFERENIVKTAEQMGRPLSPDEEKRLDYLHSEKVGKYLDAGHGECWMKDERIARLVADALKHFEGERYSLPVWCVMPNHVHVVVKPLAGHDLPDIVHSWKSFTAHEADKVLKRKGRFWEEEYYDHLIRDEADYRRCAEYVLDNPGKAGLKEWKWVSSTGVPPVKDHGRDGHATIHGYKGAIPVWVGEPDQKKAVTAADVQAFANAMRKTLRYKQDNLRDGIMLAWAFRPDAVEAAERLRRLEQTDLNFIRLDMIRIDSPRFREHVVSLSTEKADYANFLTFVQPPKIEVIFKRTAARAYKFDVSETVILNAGAKIINVQWDFDYGKRFSSTPGYSFVRGSKKEVALQAQYEFPTGGKKRIACKVQDDMGGEGLWTAEIEVE